MNGRTAPAVLPSNQTIDLVGERIALAGLWQWVRNERESGHGADMPRDCPVRCTNGKLSINNRKITAEPQVNSSLCHHNKSR
jgi:hypothetical protein